METSSEINRADRWSSRNSECGQHQNCVAKMDTWAIQFLDYIWRSPRVPDLSDLRLLSIIVHNRRHCYLYIVPI